MSVSTRLQTTKSQTNRRGSIEMPPKMQDAAQMQAMFEELLKNFQKEIRQELKDHRKESNDSLTKGLGKFEKTLDDFSKELTLVKNEVAMNKERIEKLEDSNKYLEGQQKIEENLILLQELRYRERCLKFRGLIETPNENLYGKLVSPLAEFMETTEEYLDMEIDKVFRINSEMAKEKNLPRDIIICFARSKVRDEVLQKSYENSFQIDGHRIQIFKDIPASVLRKRQEYRQLTQALNSNNIRYSWDRIEGVIFNYKQKRFRVNSKSKAEEFLKRFKRDKEKEQETRNTDSDNIRNLDS